MSTHNDKSDKELITSEEDEERYIALPAAKCRARNGVLLKQRRQKFCAKWESSFPWLKPDNVDESIGICTVCDKRLVCKKSHLERHQKTYKHQRRLGFEDASLDGNIADGDDTLPTTPEFLECGKQEPADEANEFDHAIELDPPFNMDYEFKSQKFIKKEGQEEQQHKRKIKTSSKSSKLDRIKLLKRIDRDRHELNEYFHSHRQEQLSSTKSVTQPRDTFDLFFDSVSASVKTLPPKLAAEVKNRVSQIIAEFELRAICEREAINDNASTLVQDGTTMMVATTTTQDELEAEVQHAAITDGSGVTVLPQILYISNRKISNDEGVFNVGGSLLK